MQTWEDKEPIVSDSGGGCGLIVLGIVTLAALVAPIVGTITSIVWVLQWMIQ
jgi:hypothetical protein